MSHHDHDERSADRRSGEGVRIIGAEEAQAALEAGAAAGRRADDELRFGDVPPAPSGPRPPHRFPLPDSVDPAVAVPRPPVVVPPRADSPPPRHGRVPSPEEAHDPRPWTERGAAPGGDPAAGGTDRTEALPTQPLPHDPGAPPVGADAAGGHPHAADPEPRPHTADPEPGPAAAAAGGGDPARGEHGGGPRPAPPTTGPVPGSGHPGGDGGAGATAAAMADPTEIWSSRPPAPRPPAPQPPADPAEVWATRPATPEPAAGPGDAPPDPAATAEHPAAQHPGPVVPGTGPAAHDPVPAAPAAPDLAPPDEGITVTGGFGTELPHWTEPPSGEVPRIRPDTGEGGGEEDDLAAWSALGSRSTVWRDDTTGWHEPLELDDLAEGGGVEDPGGSSDMFSFDEDFERLEEERSGAHRAVRIGGAEPDGAAAVPISSRGRRPGGARPARTGDGDGSELGSRVGVGVGLVALLLIAYAIGPVALLLLSLAVVTAAAAEVFGVLRPVGFRPATLLGLVGTAGLVLATYWRGADAIPLVTGVVFVGTMLWYLIGVVEARPLVNVAVTTTTFVWVGVLGSYAGLLLRAHHGRGLFVGAVVPAVAADIVAYFAGRRIGSRLLAPAVSPGKTVEGAVAGGVAAIILGLVIGHSVSPWGGAAHGLLLGIVVAVLAPIGDLFESMVKRDLAVKDTGTVLPGHGGILDRFDSVLLVMPAAYYLAVHFGVVH